MGSMSFTRDRGLPARLGDSVPKITFDSSPLYSITRAFGLSEDEFRVDEIKRDWKHITFLVYGKQTEDGEVTLQGTLVAKTREEIRRGLN